MKLPKEVINGVEVQPVIDEHLDCGTCIYNISSACAIYSLSKRPSNQKYNCDDIYRKDNNNVYFVKVGE